MEDEDVDLRTTSAPTTELSSNPSVPNSDAASLELPVGDEPDHSLVQTEDQLKKLAVVKLSQLHLEEDGEKSVTFTNNEEEEPVSEDNSRKVNGDCEQKEEEEARSEDLLDGEIDNPRKRKNESNRSNSLSDELNSSSSGDDSPEEFKGFKKRKVVPSLKIRIQDSVDQDPEESVKENVTDSLVSSDVVVSNEILKENELSESECTSKTHDTSSSSVTDDRPRIEPRRSARNLASAAKKKIDTPKKPKSEDQLTEYAQYLGLQPTVKFKCFMCGQSHFQSMGSLNNHQKTCGKNNSSQCSKPSVPSCDSNLSTNFRITRKVYLCSACGTYYENWKLFLHMRDRHKRHICLFCLGMFAVADKLAEHLLFKHDVHENTCKSPEEFLNLFKGSCFLTCCSCEKMFTEREDFFDHKCKEIVPAHSKDAPPHSPKCSSCNTKYGHFQNCPKVKEKSVGVPKATASAAPKKYYIPVPTDLQSSGNAVDSSKEGCVDIGVPANICPINVDNVEKKSTEKITYSVKRMETRSRTSMKIDSETTKRDVSSERTSTEDAMEIAEDRPEQVRSPVPQEEHKVDRIEDKPLGLKIKLSKKIINQVADSDSDPEVDETNDEEEESRIGESNVEPSPRVDSENSDDSDKLSVVLSEEGENGKSDDVEEKDDHKFQNGEEETRDEMPKEESHEVATKDVKFGENVQLASEEVLAMALTLEDKMDSLSSQSVVKECVRTSCTTCGYCSHAVKIGVNGKQLALHLLAEHRYMPVKNETVDDVIERLQKSLEELQDTWFNTDSYDSSNKSCFVRYDHTYECFQCNFVTKLYKDLFIHKRKVHQKTILYCSMCKANFYSYSELICHMCPGIYVSKEIQFRCCFCELDRIPSAFRLMVHLRKTHHTCDICLENAGDQQKLSTHMWKHKLHHLCYRCGIAYRNKPDITKHLFWKHGTESVLCKKCLQKKWPHVYHFCIPPTCFICEECNAIFSKAVALKVHKRIHAGDFPYSCTMCEQKFVSKKLQQKHEKGHLEPPIEEAVKAPEPVSVSEVPAEAPAAVPSQVSEVKEGGPSDQKEKKKRSKKDKEKKMKHVVDVYDLPPLNLSSESDESEDEKEKRQLPEGPAATDTEDTSTVPVESSAPEKVVENLQDTALLEPMETEPVETANQKEISINDSSVIQPVTETTEEQNQPEHSQVVDGIWDNFRTYRAEQEKRENQDVSDKQPLLLPDEPVVPPVESALGDHDYCVLYENKTPVVMESTPEKNVTQEHSSSIDHDYCNMNSAKTQCETPANVAMPNSIDKNASSPMKKKVKSPKKKKPQHSSSSSDSSSDSDSSSCSCGTNCSCSSSSSNSTSSSSSDSDSSTSDGGKLNDSSVTPKKKKKKSNQFVQPQPEEEPIVDLPVDEPPILETDLETDESSTDEDFYDQYPQRFANQLLADKRNQLMMLASVAPVNNGTASPPVTPLSILENPMTPSSDVSTPLPVEPQALNATVSTPVGSKRKSKSKKRRRLGNSSTVYESQPSTSFSMSPVLHQPVKRPAAFSPAHIPPTTPVNNLCSQDQRDENSSNDKRLSKRRRVRNKFYGYSSDEEENLRHPPVTPKWKKTVPPVRTPLPLQPTPPPPPQPPVIVPTIPQQPVSDYGFHMKAMQLMRSVENRGSNSQASRRIQNSSSSSSSSEDSDDTDRPVINPVSMNPSSFFAGNASEKDDKLYCYCQCPYDEVSEMIACDGADCAIEWFHFECVGIMVPPKGKWYCPDCRKRGSILN